jgi:FlaA1/EpsC-like NDP-sugar epimerase
MNYRKKRFLVTGACGTIGSEIVKRLLKSGAIVCAFDSYENGLFELQKKLASISIRNLKIFLGDVRSLERLIKASKDVEVIIHCAALKHVEISEYNSFEAILTNVTGVQNIIEASLQNKVKKVLFTSSDKAVNPSSFMGTTKLLGEKLITAANNHKGQNQTIFSSVRFGNVLDSNGSVLKIFKKQFDHNLPFTITSEKMNRYFMSITQAINLCFFALKEMVGGEIFIPKMFSFDILSLAKVISGKSNPKVTYTKPAMGEKLFEELITETEMNRTLFFKSNYVVIPELNKNIASPNLIKKVFGKYNKFKKIPNILRSDQNTSSLKNLKIFLKKSRLT